MVKAVVGGVSHTVVLSATNTMDVNSMGVITFSEGDAALTEKFLSGEFVLISGTAFATAPQAGNDAFLAQLDTDANTTTVSFTFNGSLADQGANNSDPSVSVGTLTPMLRSTIRSAVWYQGEQDASAPGGPSGANHTGANGGWPYNCTFPAMISAWRREWGAATLGQTPSDFPFG